MEINKSQRKVTLEVEKEDVRIRQKTRWIPPKKIVKLIKKAESVRMEIEIKASQPAITPKTRPICQKTYNR